MNEALTTIQEIVLAPIYQINDPASRLYWLYLLSAASFALVFICWQQKKSLQTTLKNFFDSQYWLHTSSRKDMQYMLLNSAIKILVIIPLFVSHLGATIIFASFFLSTFGDAPETTWSKTSIAILFTLSFFLIEDFSRFALHKLMHNVPFLWRFHKTHHSAEVLTPLTLFRVHPVEMLLYYCRGLLVFGCVSGFFIYLFRGKVTGYEILGVDMLGFLFNVCLANLRHSHIPISFGIFEKIFISPLQHQIHHRVAPEHYNKNYGVCLALWDRLFHSWLPTKSLSTAQRTMGALKFGLKPNN